MRWVIIVGLAGAAALGRDVPISVSALNYSELSDPALWSAVHADPTAQPAPPAASKPSHPLYYLALPGDVYESDMSMDAVDGQIEIALEPRGYYNLIYQQRAGHDPHRIDYLLRVHYGMRRWAKPVCRPDRITWGNDEMISVKYMAPQGEPDPRQGLDWKQVLMEKTLFAQLSSSAISRGGAAGPSANAGALGPNQGEYQTDFLDNAGDPRFLVVIEAFKFADVRKLNGKARCVWTIFLSAPVGRGDKFSNILPMMLRIGAPYAGSTTTGLQLFEIPAGRVIVGQPRVRPPEP